MAIWLWENCRDKYNIVFVFANTGGEHELTLKFGDIIPYIFGFNVIWLEAVVNPKKGFGTKHKIVTYETASRNYEPFNAVVDKYGIEIEEVEEANKLLMEDIEKMVEKNKGKKTTFSWLLNECQDDDCRERIIKTFLNYMYGYNGE